MMSRLLDHIQKYTNRERYTGDGNNSFSLIFTVYINIFHYFIISLLLQTKQNITLFPLMARHRLVWNYYGGMSEV